MINTTVSGQSQQGGIGIGECILQNALDFVLIVMKEVILFLGPGL